MATAYQRQKQKEIEDAARAAEIARMWSGFGLQPPVAGPTAGVPVSGTPYTFPGLSIPQGPPLPYTSPNVQPAAVGPAVWNFLTANPGPGFDPTGMTQEQVREKMNTNAGLPAWWPESAAGAVGQIGAAISRGGKPAPQPPAAQPWDFATGGGAAPGAPGVPSVMGTNPFLSQLAAGLQAQGITVTSGLRTKEKNAAVGGAQNSYHLTGNAMDLVPPKGTTTKQLRDMLAKSGVPFKELLDESDHVHVAVADPFTMPNLPTMDPAAAASMIPLPSGPRTVELGQVPTTPDMPPRPLETELPVADWMAQLRAFAPKGFDEKAAKEGRLGNVLMGLAAGAARADAREGVGAMLAMMGAGAQQAASAWDAQMKADKKDSEEAVRLFELGLVRQGIDFAQAQEGVRMRNRERQFNDQRDKVMNTYSDQMRQFDLDTKELLTNAGYAQNYDDALLQARTLRARTALSVIESNINATTQTILGQQQLDLKRFLFLDEKANTGISDDIAKKVTGMAAGLGIDPKLAVANKDTTALNALQGFAYMAANNKPAAINSLAREMVLSGTYKRIITDKAALKRIELAATRDPELAAVLVGQQLNAEEAKAPGTVLGVVKLMAPYGLPVATAFQRLAQPQKPAPQAGK